MNLLFSSLHKCIFSVALFSIVFLATTIQAQTVEISSGVNCINTVAVNSNGIQLTPKNISKKIKKLKKKLSSASSSKKQKKFKKKLKKQKKLKRKIKKCNNGDYQNTPSTPNPDVYIPDGIQELVGTYTADYRHGTDKPVLGFVTVTFSLVGNVFFGDISFTGYIKDTKSLPQVLFSIDFEQENGLLGFFETTATGTARGDLPVEVSSQGIIRVYNAPGTENIRLGLTRVASGNPFFGGNILFGTSGDGTEDILYFYF